MIRLYYSATYCGYGRGYMVHGSFDNAAVMLLNRIVCHDLF